MRNHALLESDTGQWMGAWPSQQPPSIPSQQIRTPHAGESKEMARCWCRRFPTTICYSEWTNLPASGRAIVDRCFIVFSSIGCCVSRCAYVELTVYIALSFFIHGHIIITLSAALYFTSVASLLCSTIWRLQACLSSVTTAVFVFHNGMQQGTIKLILACSGGNSDIRFNIVL